MFGFIGATGVLVLSPAYSSGSEITTSLRFTDQTLESVGLAVGSHVYRSASDTITIDVGPNVVPLPAAAPLFGAALLALGAAGHGSKRKRAAAA